MSSDTELILRIISGIIGIAIAAFIIQLGSLPFAIAAIVLSLLGWYEFSSIIGKKGIDTTLILGALVLILMECCAWLGSLEEIFAVLTIGMLLIFLLTVILYGTIRPVDASVSVGGIMYIGLPFSHLILLRFFDDERIAMPLESMKSFFSANPVPLVNIDMSHAFNTLLNLQFDVGTALIWLLFISTWASDTFAFFVGTAIGSHKLASTISPKKTVEGFIGALVGTPVMTAAVGSFLFSFPMTEMLILGALLAIVATLGDLVASSLKRYGGVKDSGFFLPGHGGVLDRFDSILYTAPFFYYYVIVMGIV